MAREITVLTNPAAGRGRGSRAAAIALPRLREAGLVVHHHTTRDGDHARDLARTGVAAGMEAVVVCGGDGLVHLAAQALVGSQTALGIIPAGTGNDVARDLGIPRRDPQAAADVVVGSHSRTVDVARVGATYFVTVLCAGFDSLVNERANAMRWPRGHQRYNLATLDQLRLLEPIGYTLELDGVTRSVEAILVAVGNGSSYGGGLRITHGAELDDGLLDVVLFKPVGRMELLRTFPKLYTGRHVTHRQYEHHRVRQVTVAAPGIVAYADGERLGSLPLTIDVVPNALRVLAPR